MSEVQLLFLVLALLYGWECAVWLRRGTVAFGTWFGRAWCLQHPGTLAGNQRGGFILAAPLPPLGSLLTATQFPLSLSPEGVIVWVSTNINPGWRPAQSGRFVRFDDAREIRAHGRKLLVAKEVLLKSPTPGLARWLAETLQRIAKLKLPQREAAIAELLRATLDFKAVEDRWREFQKHARPVRLLSNALFFYLFGFAPALIWQLGFGLSWLGLLVGLLALTTATATFFYRAHRVLFPFAEDERFTQTITVLLAPTTAMRAGDVLSRLLLETFHPLALAKVFLPVETFREFARHVMLDLQHPARPVCPDDSPDVRATELQARRTLQSAVENFLKQVGLDPGTLVRPPAPADESCRAYCPRCGAQFTTAGGECADCGGLALVPFAKPG